MIKAKERAKRIKKIKESKKVVNKIKATTTSNLKIKKKEAHNKILINKRKHLKSKKKLILKNKQKFQRIQMHSKCNSSNVENIILPN